MAVAGAQYGWRLDLREIAAIWRAGCIIRARMLDRIMDAYERDPSLQSLLLAEHFRDAVASAEGAWRQGSHLRSRPEYPRQRSRRASPTMTAFAASAVRRICCRACATTSARIPTDGSTSPACFTPSGPRTAPKKRPDERASLTARDARVRMSRPRGQAGFQFAACVLR